MNWFLIKSGILLADVLLAMATFFRVAAEKVVAATTKRLLK